MRPRVLRPLPYAALSAALLLPVLLPRHIPAADLPSHLYNTWLVLLVRQAQAPGLTIVPQWSNILFDWWLEGLWRLGGPALAEKMAVAAAVLIFFWGAFFWVSAITGRRAWSSVPFIAMLAYGWGYHQGFFNYYLSCGFGFWALGCVWRRPARVAPAAAALLLAALAHPLGAAAAAGLAGFVVLTYGLPPGKRALAAGLCCLGLAAAGLILLHTLPAKWEATQVFHVAFATQLRPFGEKYNAFILGVPLLWLVFIWARALRDRRALLREPALAAALILAAAISLIPGGVHLPGTARPLHFIDFRLTVFLSLVLQSLAVAAEPRRVPVLGIVQAVMAVAFFGFLASDYRHLNAAQDEFLRAAAQIPPGGRALAAATGKPIPMNPLNHMLSKACIGRCFSYGDYRASSRQFRLRAQLHSALVLDDSLDVDRYQAGQFVVRPRDLPLYGVFLRSGAPFRLSVRPLEAGERVPRQSVAIPPDWF